MILDLLASLTVKTISWNVEPDGLQNFWSCEAQVGV